MANGSTMAPPREQNKVRFEINPVAARHAGLKIYPKMLRLARIVAEGR
jgi:hypothetical protein